MTAPGTETPGTVDDADIEDEYVGRLMAGYAGGAYRIGWDAGNLPNLARDGVSGSIVPANDIDALTGALIRIAEDDELRARLSRGAKERAEDFPTWEQTADLFFSELRRVVFTSTPPGRPT